MPPAATPWSAGRLDRSVGPSQLLFGRMYEDDAVEKAAFRAGGRVFCIASAGDTAMALAQDHDVTAVDINPIQLAYAADRAEGLPTRAGAAERFMAAGRSFLALAGWRRALVEDFLVMEDPSRQLDYWRTRLDTRRFRWALDSLLRPAFLRFFYSSPLLAVLPARFGTVLRERMVRCWGRHPNRANPYARALLLGELETSSRFAPGIRFVHADAADFLESCAPGFFDGFSLSNILDGTGPAYAVRLMSAVRRAAAPGAVLVRRSFAEPAPDLVNLAAEDRSLLWGVVEAVSVGG